MCNAMHVRGHTSYNGSQDSMYCTWRPPRHTQCVQGSQWVRQWCRAGPRRGQKGGFGQLLCFSSTAPVVHHAVVAAATVSAPLNLCSLAFQPATYLVLSCFFYFYWSQGGSLLCLVTPSVTRCSCSILLRVLDLSILLDGFH